MTKGKWIDGKFLMPVASFPDAGAWLAHFESVFPERAVRMRGYSSLHGWTESEHTSWWGDICTQWADKFVEDDMSQPLNI